MKKYALIAFTVIPLLGLTGCDTGTTDKAAESQESVPKSRYDSVKELRDAFVEAGGDCPDFKQTNRVKYSAESAECSGTTVLSTYLSAESTQKRVDESKEAFAGLDSSTWLVGENWIINAPNPESFQSKMGGQLISWGDTTELDSNENNFKNQLLDDPEGFASYDFRPALEIGHEICEIYVDGVHQDVLDYLVPMSGDEFSTTQLGAILGISLNSLCPEHSGKFPSN